MPDAARAAKNENLFREVNEQILRIERELGGNPATRFICECSRPSCTARIELRLDEYSAIRDDPRQFLIALGHEQPAYERVIHSTPHYSVVEKLGLAGDIAEDSAG